MKKPEFYFVEITDTFGGEANYCWVHRYKVRAKSFLGAVQKVSRHWMPVSWRKVMDCGDLCDTIAKHVPPAFLSKHTTRKSMTN